MNDNEVNQNEIASGSESGSSVDNQSNQSTQETVTVVEVSNLTEVYEYHQVIVALECVMIGLLLALIVARVWVKYL